MTLWLVAVGFVSILGQVVLLRELLVAFFGSELIYLLAFGFLLLGTALGVWAGHFRPTFSGRKVRALLLYFAVALPLLLALARTLRVLLGAVPGAYLPFPRQLAGMVIVLLPFGLLTGLLFQRAAGFFVFGAKTLAEAYALESAGGLLGGLAATGLLAAGIQNFAAGLLCALAAAAAACIPWRTDRPRWLLPAAAAAVSILLGLLLLSPAIDRRLTAVDHPRLAASRDTPYGRATVEEAGGQVAVFQNDALAFESQGTSAEEFVHVAALQAEDPRHVLILGGAVERLASEVLKHHPQTVTDVELDERLLKLVGPYLGPSRGGVPAGVALIVADPRSFLKRPGPYDLILSGMPEPESGQADRFFTREFFAACGSRLQPRGVFAFRLRSAENLWTPALMRRNASIYAALRSIFEDVLVLPGGTNLFLASNAPLCRDPRVLADRLAARGIQARLVSPPYLRYLLTNDRLAQIAGLLEGARAPENTDSRPICYQYTLLLWLSKFFPRLSLADLSAGGAAAVIRWAFALAAVIALVFLLARRWPGGRRALLAASAGFAGMVLESALILGYQIQSGVLFQDLGVLLTAFMAGLALGALFLDRHSRRHPAGPGFWTGAALAGGTAALALLCAWLFAAGSVPGLPATALLLVACGFGVGSLFGYASLRRVESQAAAVAPLYAADLLGGCLGSLAGSLYLLPVFGLPATAVILALLALASVLLL